MVRSLSSKNKIFGRGNHKLDLFNPDFQSVLVNKVKPVLIIKGKLKLGRYKIFPNIFETIRYKIIYLKVGIFDSNTK